MQITEEHHIISGILRNPEYTTKVIEYIKPEHFQNSSAKAAFEVIKDYYDKYSKRPSKSELVISINKAVHDNDAQEEVLSYLEPLDGDKVSTEWLLDMSEEYVKKRAIFNALFESIEIAEGNSKLSDDAIPDILSDAINLSFTHDFGLDYYLDIDERLESYDDNSIKFPWKLALLNKITNGGFETKTLNLVLAPTGFGKSIFLADEAEFQSRSQGLNVVYFTMEMSDMRISKRIDSNYMQIKMHDVLSHRESLREKFEKQAKTTKGSLHIKEYSPGIATASTFSNYVKELELNKDYKVDIIIVDYLNLMASSRAPSNSNSYEKIKSIAEELIALSKKHDIPVISASQLSRSGQINTSPDVTNVSESIGLVNTVDFMFTMFDNEELKPMNRAVFKQMKNRYGDVNYYNTFMVGINRAKMNFYDIDAKESDLLVENVQTTEEKEKGGEAKTFSNFNTEFNFGNLS